MPTADLEFGWTGLCSLSVSVLLTACDDHCSDHYCVSVKLLVILCVLTCNCHLSPSNYTVSKGLSFRIHVVIVSCLSEIIIHLFRNALIVCEIILLRWQNVQSTRQTTLSDIFCEIECL